jgi:predicted O-linked N-acetylglucosamine transferase (SPINDLY family)
MQAVPLGDARARARARAREGFELHRENRLAEAVKRYREALALDPACFDALQLWGVIRFRSGEIEAGIALFERALELRPDHEPTLNNLGNALRAIGRPQDAVRAYQRAIASRPNPQLMTLQNLASALILTGDLEGAFGAFTRACEIDPQALAARAGRAGLALTFALWDRIESDVEFLMQARPKPGLPLDPGSLLLLPLPPQVLRAYAEAYARTFPGPLTVPGPAQASGSPRPLRVGYLSADFREHAVGYLMGAVLELHERSRVEPYCYAWGASSASPVRQRIAGAASRFRDVSTLADVEIARLLRADRIDIAVDLMGYTMRARPGVLAARAAPVQASWLGYPGTTGAAFIDYLIADDFVVPGGSESHFTERVMRLPHTYLPYDRARPVGASLTRAEYGLPETAVVLACFGVVQKLNPPVFGVWMDVLRSAPDAVIWFANVNPTAVGNLRREAEARGVAAGRLIFAPPLPDNADHLARYRLVDLALDTFPYGSHSTAADALWVGCPLVALIGETFASRVSGSVLTAAGAPELVTTTLERYRALILELTRDRARREALRARLEAQRLGCPLFDTPRFVRSLEQAYEAMASPAARELSKPPD